ncbi:50S ribosomal protein L10, partial [Patescibacteria group bacterium]|nr:50S ribosomal protein L10 [Patescibacteria group bacterium]
MPVTKQKKEEILKELVDKFGKSKSVVFADYRGLDVASISNLRNKLREGDAEMKVAKKTLIGLAAKENAIDNIDDSGMEGPVAATFSYEDPLSGIKVLFKFAKENENLKLLGGIIDGKVVGPEVINQYAQLPSREELLAKLMGSINAPVSGFVGILGNLLGGFVRVVNAYKDTLPPAEAAPAPETPKAEVAEVEPVVETTEAPAEPEAETSESEAPAKPDEAEDEGQAEEPVVEVTEAPVEPEPEAPAEEENK